MAQHKHLGYSHWFEMYLMRDEYTSSDWLQAILAVSKYIGFFKSWSIVVHIDNGTVIYYVGANNDIGMLSNNLEGFVLRPVDPALISIPRGITKERLVQFVSGGNVLDLREKYEVKRGRTLEWALFSIRTINVERAICDA